MNRLSLYLHTIRYLKPIQFWYRLYFKIYRPRLPNIRSLPVRPTDYTWMPCHRNSSMPSVNTFRFLNETRELNFPEDWNAPQASALWRYNLHYFDDLNAEEAELRVLHHVELIRRWIKDNADSSGIGWQPYPSSLRIVNWIKWGLSGNELDEDMRQSLALQSGFLAKRIEFHLQANHLWANAKALAFAGAFFGGSYADLWLARASTLIREQLSEQILADGGHYERSPMYHGITMEDTIDLIQLERAYPGVFDADLVMMLRHKAVAMLQWLGIMTLPDGLISFFNDSANGIAPSLSALRSYGVQFDLQEQQKPKGGLQVLSDSGYIRLDNASASMLLDVGDIGPDYQPGHGHADCLSFEMALFGKRFIVNSGIDRYGDSSERLRQRSTAAHSTVEIDHADSSEVWGGFRVARRANPFALEYSSTADTQSVRCSHDGYERLHSKTIHTRKWCLQSHKVVIADVIEGSYAIGIARFHLHPDVEASKISNSCCRLLCGGREVILEVRRGSVTIMDGHYFPEFGVRIANSCIEVELEEAECSSTFSWNENSKSLS